MSCCKAATWPFSSRDLELGVLLMDEGEGDEESIVTSNHRTGNARFYYDSCASLPSPHDIDGDVFVPCCMRLLKGYVFAMV